MATHFAGEWGESGGGRSPPPTSVTRVVIKQGGEITSAMGDVDDLYADTDDAIQQKILSDWKTPQSDNKV